jgi:hypothetical protein
MSSSGKRVRRTNAQLEAAGARVEGKKRAEEDRKQVGRENFWKPREAVGQGQPTEEGQVASAELSAGGRQGPAAVGGATWKSHVNEIRHVKLGCVGDMPKATNVHPRDLPVGGIPFTCTPHYNGVPFLAS